MMQHYKYVEIFLVLKKVTRFSVEEADKRPVL